GNRRYQLARVVSFNILDYDSPDFRNSDDYFHTVWLKDDLNEIFSDKMCLCFLELSKFAAQTRPDVALDKRRLWAYFLKHLPEMQPDEEGFTQGIFKSLMETCRMEKLNDMEKKDYEKSVLEYEDVQDAIAYARKTALAEGKTAGLAEGKAEGLAEGKAKGLAEGKAKGLAEGEAKGEANATRTIAAKMLAIGMDAAAISSLTGLTEEEILKIRL
ncbi:MAG: PD-(D/E)XK nuclease family transposase, partial [Bacteroidales bacterium]|nr:PD-(D/E)XK nuclease family transposase [Bacteroidales bacterium]